MIRRPFQPLFLSAPDPDRLQSWRQRLADDLRGRDDWDVDDLALTLATRPHHDHRLVLLAADRDDALALLAEPDRKRTAVGVAPSQPTAVVFLFEGPGDHAPGMLKGLLEVEPAYRQGMERLGEGLRHGGAASAWHYLNRDRGDDAPGEDPSESVHPALFAVEYALAELWRSWGVRPAAMLGFSLGELVAATVAGVFDPADGLRLAGARGAMFDRVASGAMTSVELPADAVAPYLVPGVEVAIVRSPRSCVISGPTEAVSQVEARLLEAEVNAVRLAVRAAGHSVMAEAVIDDLVQSVAATPRTPPAIPIVSNVSGGWLHPDEAAAPRYWGEQLRRTVQFAGGVATLAERHPDCVALEIGPGRHLTALVAGQWPKGRGLRVPSVSQVRKMDIEAWRLDCLGLMLTLGRLWACGVPIDLRAVFDDDPAAPVQLPAGP